MKKITMDTTELCLSLEQEMKIVYKKNGIISNTK